MKFLTLHQPWASLIACGAKRIETRSWATTYRGPLGIHAGAAFPQGARTLCWQEPFGRHLILAGFHDPLDLPLGAVVAVCRLADCVPTRLAVFQGLVLGHERDFGDYSFGRWAWILEDIVRLRVPVRAPGARRLWSNLVLDGRVLCQQLEEQGA